MGQLGNILEESPEGVRRGPDLRAEVEVPRAALGSDEGHDAWVPLELPLADDPERKAERVVSPLDDGERIPLRLPESFPDRGVLKLRGQGGRVEGGVPGDLLLRIRIVEGSVAAPTTGTGNAASMRSRRAIVGVLLLVLGGLLFLALWTSSGS